MNSSSAAVADCGRSRRRTTLSCSQELLLRLDSGVLRLAGSAPDSMIAMKSCRSSRVSVIDIPEQVMVDILLCLPIKEIVMCKCTCKAWRDLILSTQFVELHHAHAKSCILLGNPFEHEISRMLYSIEPSKLNANCCCDVNVLESTEPINMKLDTKLKIPLCKFNSNSMMIKAKASAHSDGVRAKRKPTIKLNSMNYDALDIRNSCNGFLCLTQRNNLTIVCNPITNEYIKVPSYNSSVSLMWVAGVGFCLKTKQFKVLQVQLYENCRSTWNINVAEIHSLGTNSWKRIGTPCEWTFLSVLEESAIYLSGVFYWIVRDPSTKRHVLSFEFFSEGFKFLPQLPSSTSSQGNISIGIIGDELCLSNDFRGLVDIWVMKSVGVPKSWSMLITIRHPITSGIDNVGNIKLASCSKCKEFLLLCCHNNLIVLYDSKRDEWRKFRIHQNEVTEVVHFTPSLISLKDIVPAASVMSISTGSKLPEETKSPYLMEEAWSIQSN